MMFCVSNCLVFIVNISCFDRNSIYIALSIKNCEPYQLRIFQCGELLPVKKTLFNGGDASDINSLA